MKHRKTRSKAVVGQMPLPWDLASPATAAPQDSPGPPPEAPLPAPPSSPQKRWRMDWHFSSSVEVPAIRVREAGQWIRYTLQILLLLAASGCPSESRSAMVSSERPHSSTSLLACGVVQSCPEELGMARALVGRPADQHPPNWASASSRLFEQNRWTPRRR
ncbi:hypothetical protein PSMK_p00040 (plasmid) [Phycisphaera mikurensis NBRC 102666]|uniref:Uncharacterized protein n=1 Tax=Phycisphaera mikurensis (strain NBRC 102666 / KCTC 22515 / FYK2301M01) TaxID=1142394 RepID=I0IJC8_PHYMF|nr:hypothetical protein PSMK_p00040 [Phycisphaera mikurensis NBRC 102666]